APESHPPSLHDALPISHSKPSQKCCPNRQSPDGLTLSISQRCVAYPRPTESHDRQKIATCRIRRDLTQRDIAFRIHKSSSHERRRERLRSKIVINLRSDRVSVSRWMKHRYGPLHVERHPSANHGSFKVVGTRDT